MDKLRESWAFPLSQEEVFYRFYTEYPGELIIKDKNGKYLFANKSAQKQLGVQSPEELIGKTDADFFPQEQTKRFKNDELRVMHDEIAIQGIAEPADNIAKLTKWYLSTKSPTYDAKGSVSGVIIGSQDITERKRIEDELRHFSEIDGLTGIYNRRLFDNLLGREWDRARRGKYPLSLLMLDVDYFKAYNDTYGHQAGDQCLRQFAAILKDQVKRPGDLACRYGGEEFALMLPATDLKGAIVVGKRIAAGLEALKIEHKGSEISDQLSFSWGIATTFPHEGGFPEELIKHSDTALYKAKKAGRNTYSTWPE